MPKNLLVKTIRKIYYLINKEPDSAQAKRVIPWFKDNGDKTLRLNYNLNEKSMVFDLGGYEGQWTSDIYCMYNCTVYIFEPVESFYNQIVARFKKNKHIKPFMFGLSNDNKKETLSIEADSSSSFKKEGKLAEIELKKASEFIKKNKIKKIDLMKINIEGGEYELLEHLIETKDIKKIQNIQVQFHDFIPDAERRMKNIQNNLEKTHHVTYQYPFVWENWERNT